MDIYFSQFQALITNSILKSEKLCDRHEQCLNFGANVNVNDFQESMSIPNVNVDQLSLTIVNVNDNVNVLIFLNVNVLRFVNDY